MLGRSGQLARWLEKFFWPFEHVAACQNLHCALFSVSLFYRITYLTNNFFVLLFWTFSCISLLSIRRGILILRCKWRLLNENILHRIPISLFMQNWHQLFGKIFDTFGSESKLKYKLHMIFVIFEELFWCRSGKWLNLVCSWRS